MLTRSRGDFDEILAEQRPDRRADRRHRAGARLRAARDAGRQARRLAPTSCCSPPRRGAVERRARATACSCASRAPWRASCRSSACCRSRSPAAHVERIHGIVNGTTNFILTEMARGGLDLRVPRSPARRSSATPRPTRPTTSPAATPRPRWRSSPGSRSPRPVHLDQVIYEGIEHITRRGRRLRARPRARAEADRHRRARRRRHLRPRAPRVPVSRPPAGVRQRLVQRRHGRVRRDHRDHALAAPARAARRPRARCWAT